MFYLCSLRWPLIDLPGWPVYFALHVSGMLQVTLSAQATKGFDASDILSTFHIKVQLTFTSSVTFLVPRKSPWCQLGLHFFSVSMRFCECARWPPDSSFCWTRSPACYPDFVLSFARRLLLRQATGLGILPKLDVPLAGWSLPHDHKTFELCLSNRALQCLASPTWVWGTEWQETFVSLRMICPTRATQ